MRRRSEVRRCDTSDWLTLDDDLADDPLKGINVDAAGGASKVLKMLAEKVRLRAQTLADIQTKSEQPSAESTPPHSKEKEGVVAKRQDEQLACEFCCGVS